MQDGDQAKFRTLLTNTLAFYRQDVSKFALSVWWQACQGFDFEQVSKALTAHAMDPDRGQFAPKPADIVRVLQGTRTDRGLVAWGKVYAAMCSVGAYQSVAFDDPAIHLAVEDLGGWVTLCRIQTDELPFVERRFTDAYKAHALRPDTPHPARLIGESETVNQSAQMTAAQQERLEGRTVLVGDAQGARAVIASGGRSARHPMTLAIAAVPVPQRLGNAA